jgi:hypothetical protein
MAPIQRDQLCGFQVVGRKYVRATAVSFEVIEKARQHQGSGAIHSSQVREIEFDCIALGDAQLRVLNGTAYRRRMGQVE